MNKKDINIKGFVNSYLATAEWITCEGDECRDFTRDAQKRATQDCEKFIDAVIEKFGEEKGVELLNTDGGNDVRYLAAYDFFLARNRHGADFRDKLTEYGGDENAKALVQISQDMKEVVCYHIRGKKSKLIFD